MEDLNKNALNDDELDNVSGGAMIHGDVNGTWMYKFQYQATPGKFVTVTSKEKYSNKGKALKAGKAAQLKYLFKHPTQLIIFEQR